MTEELEMLDYFEQGVFAILKGIWTLAQLLFLLVVFAFTSLFKAADYVRGKIEKR